MTKLESLYHELLKKEVATPEEIKTIASDILKDRPFSYIYNEYLTKLEKRGKLLHPRRGLYVAVPPLKINDNSFQPDRYLMASKIQDPYYLGYHTGLEVYGVAYSSYNEVYIVVEPSKKFRSFRFKDVLYRPVYNSIHDLEVKTMVHRGQNLVVSSPSRTFLDCIDRPEYSGGWEECLKSLESLSGVKVEGLIKVLDAMGKDMMYRKTGLVLELFDDNPYYEGILSEIFPYLKDNMGSSPMYLREGSKSELSEEWKLYVPKDFKEILKGV